jgi:hypothetical protein
MRTEALQPGLGGLAVLPAVALVDLGQHAPHAQDLLRVDGDVRGLAGRAARGLCARVGACGRAGQVWTHGGS